MCSPLSSTLAEMYLQNIENIYIKQWLDSNEIPYYKRYVNIIILFNTQKTQEEQLLTSINSINKRLSFNITKEDNTKIKFLDFTLIRTKNNIQVNIERKPAHSNPLSFQSPNRAENGSI